jgi:hypothetical protein
MAIFFLYMYLLQNCNNYQSWRILLVLDGAVRLLVDHCPTKGSRGFPSIQTCAVLHYHAEGRYVRMQLSKKLLYFFQTPESGSKVDFLPTPHRIHNNQSFTVPEESSLELTWWHQISDFFFVRYYGWCHFMHRHSVSGERIMHPGYSPVINLG